MFRFFSMSLNLQKYRHSSPPGMREYLLNQGLMTCFREKRKKSDLPRFYDLLQARKSKGKAAFLFSFCFLKCHGAVFWSSISSTPSTPTNKKRHFRCAYRNNETPVFRDFKLKIEMSGDVQQAVILDNLPDNYGNKIVKLYLTKCLYFLLNMSQDQCVLGTVAICLSFLGIYSYCSIL